MSDYPEHDKLAKVSEQTQAIGDFLDWIGAERGARLMAWREWDEQTVDECPNCHYSARSIAACSRCDDKGMAEVPRHYECWVPLDGSAQSWLADWAGVDLHKLECEKRAMLDALRTRSTAGGG